MGERAGDRDVEKLRLCVGGGNFVVVVSFVGSGCIAMTVAGGHNMLKASRVVNLAHVHLYSGCNSSTGVESSVVS